MLAFLDSIHEHRLQSRAVLGYSRNYFEHFLAHLCVGHQSLHNLELLEVCLPSTSLLRIDKLANNLLNHDTLVKHFV